MYLTNRDDEYIGDDAEVLGLRGDDFLASTNLLGATLVGNRGRDQLVGNDGNDVLKGGKGFDILDGNDGCDILKGGRGTDRFVFDIEDTGVDCIRDFKSGIDSISISVLGAGERLDDDAFATSFGDVTADTRVIYDDGRLYYDADGSGSADAVCLTKLKDAPIVEASDILI